MTLVEKLQDLIKQATTERSHYYVKSVCAEAITAIARADKESEGHQFYKREWESTCERLQYVTEQRDDLTELCLNDASKLLAERAKSAKLVEALRELVFGVIKYAENGLIENYTSDKGKDLSDCVEDAEDAIAGYLKSADGA